MSDSRAGSGRTYFIADLHLTDERPETNGRFFHFVDHIAAGADALYILGDLFEYWIGDDDLAQPIAIETAGKLSALQKSGTPVYFMHGNRDFMLADHYALKSGMELINDPAMINLYGASTLLLHGDTLCTDDHAYQAYRSKIRRPWVQSLLRALPLSVRRRMARVARAGSASAKQSKSDEIMDVNPLEVEREMRAHGYPRMIHGHTHRPAHHVHQVDGHHCDRWVLPDWYQTGGYLVCTDQDCRIERV